MAKPDTLVMVRLARELYASPDGAAGCCLHILLDDGNYRDDDACFCFETAQYSGHERCAVLAEMLVRASATQRRKVAALKWEKP